ncbi:MAG: energy-coupling factor transporter transmembrane component T [Micrococcales bacterium]
MLATLTGSPLYLAAAIAFSLLAMSLFRDKSLRARSLGFYIALASSVVLIRVTFRILFNQPDLSQKTVFDFPRISIANLFSILGPVSDLSLHAAAIDGLRLAAIILAIGMANTIANPRKLLRSTPGALYEIATAAAVAINLAPQLVESLHRVRRARSLRSKTKGFKAFRTIVIPVLEDAIDRSLSLAASMDARGFGRQEPQSKVQALTTRSITIAAILLLAIGSFTLLASNFQTLAWVSIGLGMSLLVVTFKLQSKRQLRTFYRPEKPGAFDAISFVMITSVFLLIASIR